MTEKCNYPDCCCPIDKTAEENTCLLGLEEQNEAATTPEADAVGLSATNDLLSVRVSDQGGNTTMIHIDYMRDGLRRSLTISDTCRTSRFRMDVLKELLDR